MDSLPGILSHIIVDDALSTLGEGVDRHQRLLQPGRAR
jgi:hypothetical protein